MTAAAPPNPASALPRFLDEAAALSCIHCGLCLSSCPTYLETGNENDSPRGRIYQMRALQDARLALAPGTVRHIDLCLGCRACEAACPSGVRYGELLETTRDFIETHHRRTPGESFLRRVLIERIVPHPERVELALLPARLLKRLGADRWLPDSLRRFTDLIPDDLTRPKPLPEFLPATTSERLGRVGFVTGCVMDVLFNRTNWNSVRLLNAAGYDVVIPKTQGCCGALHAHSGRLTAARDCAQHNLTAFDAARLDAIVINAAGCGSTLKEYDHLLAGEKRFADRAIAFSQKVRDLSEALVAAPGFIERLEAAARTRGDTDPVTFHDACHLAHAQGITLPPRQLVRAASGGHLVEMPESDVCCGSAGSFNLTEPEMARRLQERKTANIRSAGANLVITTNPGCLLQIQSGLRRANHDALRVIHLADYLAKVLGLDERAAAGR